MAKLVGILAVTGAVLACAAGSATGSTLLGDRNVHDATLAVDKKGTAVVTYVTATGQQRHVLAWGAINALPHPSATGGTQVHFTFDYSGGWKSHNDSNYWKKLVNVCRPYDGPQLPFFVTGCDAPDGSYWALQAWQRNLPMRGFDPWTSAQKAVELHLSHWSGPLPVLEIYEHWTYGGAQQGFFGRLTYLGQPVYGTRPRRRRCRTRGRATSTSMRTTPTTVPAGSTTRRSRRIRGTARSATRSSRRLRPPGTRARGRTETDSASSTGCR